MLRSRLLLRIAALCGLLASVACHSGTETQSPSARAETTGADSDVRAFPKQDARTALNAASRGLKSCRSEGGPGQLEAAVKFEPTGKVSTVDVKPAAEPVAACVREKLAQVAVMPFEGSAVTMSMQVRL
jgi:hypothetical protein